jgi:hypothetical protein
MIYVLVLGLILVAIAKIRINQLLGDRSMCVRHKWMIDKDGLICEQCKRRPGDDRS